MRGVVIEHRIERATPRLELIDVPRLQPSVTFASEVATGLSQPQKTLPTRFLYDATGSDLFEQITELPEYYPTRIERSILEQQAESIIEACGRDLAVVEFGSGSSAKTRLLLESALAQQCALTYVPIDISTEFLHRTSVGLLERYERLSIRALSGEYFDAIDAIPSHHGPRLIIFLGSNIGNLSRDESIDFLTRVRKRLDPKDRLLVGIDLVKEVPILEAAYNDEAGITAAFNRNLLHRINRELEGRFVVPSFRHSAPYDEAAQRVEMRLYSDQSQCVSIDAIGQSFDFAAGEFIHTEWSHKYTQASFGNLCGQAGLEILHHWTDAREWFSLVLLGPDSGLSPQP